MFNYWQPVWPESLRNQLNPDVTVRTRGVMEKCSFCVQRIRRAERTAIQEGRDLVEGEFATACVQACPTGTLVFGDINNPDSKVADLAHDRRNYRLLEGIGTEPNVVYLKKVDPDYENVGANEH
jgi:molybdopterin-containing oxidoreductase family iron-sulfur binding subunit